MANKKSILGKGLKVDVVVTIIVTIIVLVIISSLVADTGSDVGNAAGNLTEVVNASGDCVSGGNCGGSVYPLATLYRKKGVILLAFMAGLAVTIIVALLKPNK